MNYKTDPSINQSLLKKILIHPGLFLNKKSLESQGLTLGSLVDCLILTPEKYHSKFKLIENLQITDILKDIWKLYREEIKLFRPDKNDEIDLKILDEVALKLNYRVTQNNVRIPKILETIDYYKFLVEIENSEDLIFITPEIKQKADLVVESLLSNLFTRNIIKAFTDTDVPIYFQIEGYNKRFKALLDALIIDHENRTIEPWDLKTTSDSTSNFRKAIYKYRYDFQAAFYTEALKYQYPNYEILPFKFLVESTEYPGSPLIYKMSDYALSIGKFGGPIEGKHYSGFLEAIDLLIWHTNNDVWNYTKIEYENNGIITI